MSERSAGFRISKTDVVFLSLCVLFSWGMRPWLMEFSWMSVVAAGHFFLFCNVFRVRRSYELLWSAIFLANFLGGVYADAFLWSRVLMIQTPVTLLAIGMEMKSTRYHGIYSRRINANHLDEWLADEID